MNLYQCPCGSLLNLASYMANGCNHCLNCGTLISHCDVCGKNGHGAALVMEAEWPVDEPVIVEAEHANRFLPAS